MFGGSISQVWFFLSSFSSIPPVHPYLSPSILCSFSSIGDVAYLQSVVNGNASGPSQFIAVGIECGISLDKNGRLQVY